MPASETADAGPIDQPPASEFVADAKRALRARMRALTRAIGADPDERRRRSDVLCDRLVAVVEGRFRSMTDQSGPFRVMVYEPWRTEPDLGPFVAWCRARGVETYVPEVGTGRDADAMRAMPGDIDPAILHVVVVPGLAFTLAGQRLGRGRGHYDRFLPRLPPDCLRVAVAFREQVVGELPTEPHDVVLDCILVDA